MTKQTIEVEGLPKGYKSIAYRQPKNGLELCLVEGRIRSANTVNCSYEQLIVEKIQPRRIVLESTLETRNPNEGEYVQTNGNFCKCYKPERWGNEHEIWREVKETESSLTNCALELNQEELNLLSIIPIEQRLLDDPEMLELLGKIKAAKVQDDPLREMKIRQAMTGQPVWVRMVTAGYGAVVSVTTTPDWNLDAEYSFTPFEGEV